MALLIDRIEVIDIKHLDYALDQFSEMNDEVWGVLFNGSGITIKGDMVTLNKNQTTNNLTFVGHDLIQSYLKVLIKENISTIDEDIIYGMKCLHRLSTLNIKNIMISTHQMTIAQLSSYSISTSGLKIQLNEENGKNLPISTAMVCFIRTLIQHEILHYLSDEDSIRFVVKRNIPIFNSQNKLISQLLLVDLDHPFEREVANHQKEHLDKDMTILQANIDDMNPEMVPYVIEKLLQAGANDVYFYPILMKKGRSGFILNVLCNVRKVKMLKTIIFKETTTIGVRGLPVEVHRLGRTFDKVKTSWGHITIKIAKYEDDIVQVAPEFEDCKKLAIEHDVPLKLVYQSAVNEINQTYGPKINLRTPTERSKDT